MASNIEKILDVLDDNETDINKIANISPFFIGEFNEKCTLNYTKERSRWFFIF